MRILAPFLLCAAAFAADPLTAPFLSSAPDIDGRLDSGLERLPAHSFPEAAIQWRIAYGARFLYLHFDIAKPALAARDRAYQNGDGFHLVLARRGATPSREFVVLGFSPMAAEGARVRAFTWYRNVDLDGRALGGARVAVVRDGARTGVEVLVPWSAVHPFHPWMMDDVGFNLCWVEAVGGTGRKLHFVEPDPRMQSEQSPRLSVPIAFERPRNLNEPQLWAAPERNHIDAGSPVKLRVVGAGKGQVTVNTSIVDAAGKEWFSRNITATGAVDLRRTEETLAPKNLPPGMYTLRWGTEATALTVLPRVDLDAMAKRLATARISAGSAATLEFHIGQARERTAELKPYETADDLLAGLAFLDDALAAAGRGIDRLGSASGTMRRAFRSKVDGTLRPYSVRTPAGFDRKRKYPLFVYLHGSGEDDRRQLDRAWFPQDWILLAPNGRGTSNCYSAGHAQDDIREALDDALANYPIDPNRIVLAGFSMGGYGVYRTALEIGPRFRAFAIFSGHPSLANVFLGPGHPDFLAKPELLAALKDKPVFLFHGAQDRNCPYALTEALAEKLRTAGARLDFVVENDKGHETASEETLRKFAAWLVNLR